jgi:hypothetical protein
MQRISNHPRWVAGFLLAASLMAFLSPIAEAGHRERRYRGDVRVVRRVFAPAPVVRFSGRPACGTYIVRRGGAGPVIAGFLGGLFLGASLASAAPDGYAYFDPYCHESFATLDLYYGHLCRHHHPRVVRVIEVESGRCIHSYRYHDGDWEGWDGEDEDWDE